MSKFLPDAAPRFAQEWINGWNAIDIDAVLEHYTEDFEFSSPIATIASQGNGTLKGKAAIREYWTKALGRSRATSPRSGFVQLFNQPDAVNLRPSQLPIVAALG